MRAVLIVPDCPRTFCVDGQTISARSDQALMQALTDWLAYRQATGIKLAA